VADSLRQLPSVDRVLREPAAATLIARAGRPYAVQVVRRVLADYRAALSTGDRHPATDDLARRVAEQSLATDQATLRRVVNATGVIVHTNLGRAPLAEQALAAVAATAAGYTNLDYDLSDGVRGSRQAPFDVLLCDLTGAEAAFVTNNNAAAIVLCVAALAAGREVIVSRGELVEIGGSFRIPDMLAAAGAQLVEVGTTNRTTLADYKQAITTETALLLRVHPSNYRVIGFTERVAVGDLAALGDRHGLIVIDDLGSGVLERDPLFGDEPAVRDAIRAGVAAACFSADKLLGGPQAGIIAGRRDVISRIHRHPLARAMRIGKLEAAALEATLRLHRDPQRARELVPVLRMAHEPVERVRERARRIADAVAGRLVESDARVGGGSLPLLSLPSFACAIDDAGGELQTRLRRGEPPVIGRMLDGALLLDARTLTDADADLVVRAVHAHAR
jgi:L-seryl-tRNA(Ser) seleniumtransferase